MICEVPEEHPFVQVEMMMPVLGIVRVQNIDEAIGMAVRAEHGCRHSAHIHSKNIDHLTRFAKAVETTIFVKNAPSFAGIGAGGGGLYNLYDCRADRRRADGGALLYTCAALRIG